ncbi:hypothetical protein JSQ81_11390 [Sporosarcina sp. Marseille-Q4063]|uniref:hypothetical protein n=1 Tax=Sporosarcina sp. Marseille-Q4063 TaxID=2810514 RepID=UPI001BAEB1FF|nr:hypothetical protein [Sporosarcina sp. Marseille-Q4063]QUW20465.1 hypothetical protein JSQ81_11390 [Sporosarcina sp. Marseille-Q4063]
MNRILLSLSIFAFLLLGFGGTTTEAETKTEVIPQDQVPSLMERAFLRSLGGTILDIMSNHGDNQLFEFERIEKIVSRNVQYDVTLRVIGFEGAHGPPYKLIRMTIRIPGDKSADYSVLSYSRRHISERELEKLIKFAKYD